MKAVNLIPSDAQQSGGRSLKLAPATYALLGFLAAGVVLVTMYVLTGNSVSSRQSQLASLQSQLTQAQSEASQLAAYGQFASLAQTRLQTVRGLAATRFDWNASLSNLARVIPAGTALQSLNATVVPGASSGGTGGGGLGTGGNGLRSSLPGPALEMTGCTTTQDAVARLISRLRAMPGVSRVALSGSAKSTSSPNSTPGAATQGCAANSPTFNIVVFFTPVNGAGPNGATSVSGTPATATTGGAQ